MRFTLWVVAVGGFVAGCSCSEWGLQYPVDGGPTDGTLSMGDANRRDGGRDAGRPLDGDVGMPTDTNVMMDAFDVGGCHLWTCATASASCGMITDGCDLVLNCVPRRAGVRTGCARHRRRTCPVACRFRSSEPGRSHR